MHHSLTSRVIYGSIVSSSIWGENIVRALNYVKAPECGMNVLLQNTSAVLMMIYVVRCCTFITIRQYCIINLRKWRLYLLPAATLLRDISIISCFNCPYSLHFYNSCNFIVIHLLHGLNSCLLCSSMWQSFVRSSFFTLCLRVHSFF